MKLLFRLLPSLVIALTLDGLTKVWAEQILEPFQPVAIVGDIFRLTLGYNTGVAFGMFANGGIWPLILTGLVITGLVIWFILALWSGKFPQSANWPIGLLLGGALGNFIDRLSDGHVTDFIDVGLGATRWPTFNLADSFILIGLAWLMMITNSNRPDPEKDHVLIESD